MTQRTVEAKLEALETLLALTRDELEAAACPQREKNQILIAVDELFSNIARYAYGPQGGNVQFSVQARPGAAELCFADEGVPYDPLQTDAPDLALSAQERQVGGLGIFMVRKLMDEMTYEYRDGRNLLRIRKNWQTP